MTKYFAASTFPLLALAVTHRQMTALSTDCKFTWRMQFVTRNGHRQ